MGAKWAAILVLCQGGFKQSAWAQDYTCRSIPALRPALPPLGSLSLVPGAGGQWSPLASLEALVAVLPGPGGREGEGKVGYGEATQERNATHGVAIHSRRQEKGLLGVREEGGECSIHT